jgi:DNA ligase-4
VAALITSNGGRVVGLDEPKLTHIVVDKRDVSRRLELMKRTSKYVSERQPFWGIHLTFACAVRPKRRHLVVSEFITACLEECTLLDEEGKFP